jgi:multidrug efflux pump subunit AcrA (membrane-fusion protein)
MRFLTRAFTGGLITLATIAILFWGARPFFACMPAFKNVDTFSVLGLSIATRALVGEKCAFDRESRRHRKGGQQRELVVATTPLNFGDFAPVMDAYGVIRSGKTLELRAPAAGRLVAVSETFTDGADIAAQEILFEVDPADQAARQADAESALAEARVNAADAKRALTFAYADFDAAVEQRDLRRKALQRQKALAERGVATKAAIENAQLALAEAERAVITRDQARKAAETRSEQSVFSVKRAEIALRNAQRDLTETVVRAPFDGVIHVEDGPPQLGRLVMLNEKLGSLIDPNRLEVAVQLSDAAFARLIDEDGRLLDLESRVFLDLGSRTISAPTKLRRVSATVSAQSGGRIVYAALQESSTARSFRPGDFVRIVIQEPVLRNVARAPSRAVSPSGAILLLGADGRIIAEKVTVIRWIQDEAVFKGAQDLDGGKIILERTPQLAAGVRAIDSAADATGAAAEEADIGARMPERAGHGGAERGAKRDSKHDAKRERGQNRRRDGRAGAGRQPQAEGS